MITTSTKYNKIFDFRAILTSKNSILKNTSSFLDSNSAIDLRNKASKNKTGITFISQIKNSKFSNIYFFNTKEGLNEYEYQELGGAIINEAYKLKKEKIELLLDTLPTKLLNHKILKNILIGMISRNYAFKNYKLDKTNKQIKNIILV